MLIDVISATPLGANRLSIRFEDGVEGVVDVAALVPFTGIFAPLADVAFFARAGVNPELGTVVWPNGADLDPDVLYSLITSTPIPAYAGAASRESAE